MGVSTKRCLTFGMKNDEWNFNGLRSILKFSIDLSDVKRRHFLCLVAEIANHDNELCANSSVSLCQWELSSLRDRMTLAVGAWRLQPHGYFEMRGMWRAACWDLRSSFCWISWRSMIECSHRCSAERPARYCLLHFTRAMILNVFIHTHNGLSNFT